MSLGNDHTATIMPSGSDGVADAGPIGEVDGRTMRRHRNRDAVIRALIELIREGDLDPTVAKIAERAQVSHRSIFRYFEDLADLARTALETEMLESLPEAMVSDVGRGTLDERIGRMVDVRLHVLAKTDHLLRVARAKALVIPELDEGITMLAELQRDQIRQHFATELAAIRTAGRNADAIAVSVAVALSYDAWDQMHRFDGLSLPEIRDVWTTSIRALLRAD
ncbi:MAG: TetR/AcrR family transcriptional regulator [Actinomycetota bacterium]